MLTFLGARTELDVDLIDPQSSKTAKCLFIEGYLLDAPTSRAAARKALSSAAGSGRLTALALSDPDCVARNRTIFRQVMKSGVGLLIANEAEITSLYQTNKFEETISQVAREVKQTVLTRGSKGCVVIVNGRQTAISAEKVARVVDSTGAGDMFIAGLLFGLCRGKSLEQSAQLGSFAAAEIISQISARPEVRLGHSAMLRGLLA
jgi:sugar/nucleoside kinase (ribokinase family)